MHTAAIILGLIGVLLPFLLVDLRRYALRPAATDRWEQTPPAPLTAGALLQLAAWQRLNLLLFAAFVVLGLGGGLRSWTGLAKNGMGLIVFAVFLLVGLLGLAHHFSAKCPRCGLRIGVQNSLVLPCTCLRCGVTLRQDC
ncbi:MAG: hypothetical protein GX835_07375 [Desulfobulbaceae bacterium]|nr:hypothetical protein [Desulfobulbaceae bacterium]